MTNRIPTPPDARTVIVGVDTHKHVHVAVAIDSWGIRLRDQAFVADSGGYQALITWAETPIVRPTHLAAGKPLNLTSHSSATRSRLGGSSSAKCGWTTYTSPSATAAVVACDS